MDIIQTKYAHRFIFFDKPVEVDYHMGNNALFNDFFMYKWKIMNIDEVRSDIRNRSERLEYDEMGYIGDTTIDFDMEEFQEEFQEDDLLYQMIQSSQPLEKDWKPLINVNHEEVSFCWFLNINENSPYFHKVIFIHQEYQESKYVGDISYFLDHIHSIVFDYYDHHNSRPSQIIQVDTIPGHHFKDIQSVTPFINHYFEEIHPTNPNYRHKATIDSINYSIHPHATWRIRVFDTRYVDKTLIYEVVNFRDLVHHYEKQGLQFK